MKRWKIVALATPVALFGLLSMCKTLGIFTWHRSASVANEPTLKHGSIFFATNAFAGKRGDFIVYHSPAIDSMFSGTADLQVFAPVYVHRLCGDAGDTLYMKNQVLYVNGKNVDVPLTLTLYYRINQQALQQMGLNYDSLVALADYRYYDKDSTIGILLNSSIANKFSIQPTDILDSYAGDTSTIFKWLPQRKPHFNSGNFGPIIVPPDCVFVMGDNRFNSLDSRYVGFVEKRNIVATVLWK